MNNPFLNYSPAAPGSAIGFAPAKQPGGNVFMRFGSNIKDMAMGLIPGVLDIGAATAQDTRNLFTGAQGDFKLDDIGKAFAKSMWESPVYGGAIRTNPFDVAIDTILNGPVDAFKEQKRDISEALSDAWANPGYAAMDASIIFPLAGAPARVARASGNSKMLRATGHKRLDLDSMGSKGMEDWFAKGAAARHPNQTLHFDDGTSDVSKLYGGSRRGSEAPIVGDDGGLYVWQQYRNPDPKFWETLKDDLNHGISPEAADDINASMLELLKDRPAANIAEIEAAVRQSRSMNPLSAYLGDGLYGIMDKKVHPNTPLIGSRRRWRKKVIRAANVNQTPIDDAQARLVALKKHLEKPVQLLRPDDSRELIWDQIDDALGLLAQARHVAGEESWQQHVQNQINYRGINTGTVTLRIDDETPISSLRQHGIDITKPLQDRAERMGQFTTQGTRERTAGQLVKETFDAMEAEAQRRHQTSLSQLNDLDRQAIFNSMSQRRFEAFEITPFERQMMDAFAKEKAGFDELWEHITESGLSHGDAKKLDLRQFAEKHPAIKKVLLKYYNTLEEVPESFIGTITRWAGSDGVSRNRPYAQYATEGWGGALNAAQPVVDPGGTKAMLHAIADTTSYAGETGHLGARFLRNPDAINVSQQKGDSPRVRETYRRAANDQIELTQTLLTLMNLMVGMKGLPRIQRAVNTLSRTTGGHGGLTPNVIRKVQRISQHGKTREAKMMSDKFAEHLELAEVMLAKWVQNLSKKQPAVGVEPPGLIRAVRTAMADLTDAFIKELADQGINPEISPFIHKDLNLFQALVAQKYIEIKQSVLDTHSFYESQGGALGVAFEQALKAYGNKAFTDHLEAILSDPATKSRFFNRLDNINRSQNEYTLISDSTGPMMSRLYSMWESSEDDIAGLAREVGDPTGMLDAMLEGRMEIDPYVVAGHGREVILTMIEDVINRFGERSPYGHMNRGAIEGTLRRMFYRANLDANQRKQVDQFIEMATRSITRAVRESDNAYIRKDHSMNHLNRGRTRFDLEDDPFDSFNLIYTERMARTDPHMRENLESATRQVLEDAGEDTSISFDALLQSARSETVNPDKHKPKASAYIEKIIEMVEDRIHTDASRMGNVLDELTMAYMDIHRREQGVVNEAHHASGIYGDFARHRAEKPEEPFDIRKHDASSQDRRLYKDFDPVAGTITLRPRMERRTAWSGENLDNEGMPLNPNSDAVQALIEANHYFGDIIKVIEGDPVAMQKLRELLDEMLADSKDAVAYIKGLDDENGGLAELTANETRWRDYLAPWSEAQDTIHMPIQLISKEERNRPRKRRKDLELASGHRYNKTPKERMLQKGVAYKLRGQYANDGYRAGISSWFDDFARNRRMVGTRAVARNAFGFGARVTTSKVRELISRGALSSKIDDGTPLLLIDRDSDLIQRILDMANEATELDKHIEGSAYIGFRQTMLEVFEDLGADDLLDSWLRAQAANKRMTREMVPSEKVPIEELGDKVQERSQRHREGESGKPISETPIDIANETDHIVIPRAAYDMLNDELRGWDSAILQALNSPLELWKSTVLQLRAASWMRNNYMGSALMFLLSGNPIESWRAMQTVYAGGWTRKNHEKRKREWEREVREEDYIEVLEEIQREKYIEMMHEGVSPTALNSRVPGDALRSASIVPDMTEASRFRDFLLEDPKWGVYIQRAQETVPPAPRSMRGTVMKEALADLRANGVDVPDHVDDLVRMWEKNQIDERHEPFSSEQYYADKALSALTEALLQHGMKVRAQQRRFDRKKKELLEEAEKKIRKSRSPKKGEWVPEEMIPSDDEIMRMVSKEGAPRFGKGALRGQFTSGWKFRHDKATNSLEWGPEWFMENHDEIKASLDQSEVDMTLAQAPSGVKHDGNQSVTSWNDPESTVNAIDAMLGPDTVVYRIDDHVMADMNVLNQHPSEAIAEIMAWAHRQSDERGFSMDIQSIVDETGIYGRGDIADETFLIAEGEGGIVLFKARPDTSRVAEFTPGMITEVAEVAPRVPVETKILLKMEPWDKPANVSTDAPQDVIAGSRLGKDDISSVRSTPVEKEREVRTTREVKRTRTVGEPPREPTEAERQMAAQYKYNTVGLTDSGASRGIATFRRMEKRRGSKSRLDRMLVPYFELMNVIAEWNAIIADTPWRAAHAVRTVTSIADEQVKAMRAAGLEPPPRIEIIEDIMRDPKHRSRVLEETLGDMVDFADMSKKEREFVGLIFPFWSWMKGSSKAYLRMMSNRPEALLAMNEIGQLGSIMSDENMGESIPEYMRAFWKVPGTDYAINTTGMNPFQTPADLLNVFLPTNRPLYGSENILGNANPFLKAGVEALTGRDVFLGTALPEDQGPMETFVKRSLNIPLLKFGQDMVLGTNRNPGISTASTEKSRGTVLANYFGIPVQKPRPYYAWLRGRDEANTYYGSQWAYPSMRRSIPGHG